MKLNIYKGEANTFSSLLLYLKRSLGICLWLVLDNSLVQAEISLYGCLVRSPNRILCCQWQMNWSRRTGGWKGAFSFYTELIFTGQWQRMYKQKIRAFKTCWDDTSSAMNKSVEAKLTQAFIVFLGMFTSKPAPVTSSNSAMAYCHVLKV